MFSSWDPKDSFSITITNTGGCQAMFDAATDSGPHRCPTRRGGRWNTEYDNISVMNAERVWIDHNTFTDEPRFDRQFPPVFAAPFNEATQKMQHHDGHVDVTLLATKVTISNNHFHRHDKTNLLGGSDFANLVPDYGPGQDRRHLPRQLLPEHHPAHAARALRPGARLQQLLRGRPQDAAERGVSPGRRRGPPAPRPSSYTENNLFEIRNNNLTIPRIINYASTVANRDLCVDVGYAPEDCGTYYYDTGTWVTMTPSTRAARDRTSTTLSNAFAALQAIQAGSAANAPLIELDPADPAVYWLPSQSYAYTAMPVLTPEERAALRASDRGRSGGGQALVLLYSRRRPAVVVP